MVRNENKPRLLHVNCVAPPKCSVDRLTRHFMNRQHNTAFIRDFESLVGKFTSALGWGAWWESTSPVARDPGRRAVVKHGKDATIEI
jgi:hypothetical protein